MTATQTPPTATEPVTRTPRIGVESDATRKLIENARSIGPIIREHAATTEGERRVAKPVLDALSAAGLQGMFAPQSLGGLEVDPVTCARVVEEVASFDSAAGWALQSGNVNWWWSSRLTDRGIGDIYGSDPGLLMAAAFHPPQRVVEVEGGYRTTGRGPLASNVHDSEWVLLGAMVFDGDQPRMTEHGPEMIAIVLPISDVQIIDTWHTLGMRGTDSNDVAFKDVFVPQDHTFPLSPQFAPATGFSGALYRFPAVPIISLFSSAVLMATARNSITAFRHLAERKTPFGAMKTLRDRGTVQSRLAEAEGLLRSARAFFYDTMSEAWRRTEAGGENTMEQRADLLLAGINAAKSSAQVTEIVHLLAGTSGIYESSVLERYFRDAHTLRHHGFCSESKLETVGQIYLGLPPDFPLIVF